MDTANEILISFIIPVYNAERYLRECVDSILGQKSGGFEIILVDDGSTDKGGEICDKYSLKYPNVRTIHQPNAGVAAARNSGMQASGGEYLQFVDNDDKINGGELENLIDLIHKIGADIFIHKYLLVGKETSTGNSFIDAARINGKSSDAVLEYMRTSRVNVTAPWEYTVRKKVLTENKISFNSNQNGVDDSVFTPMVFCSAQSFYFTGKTFYSWQMREDSQGSTHGKKEFIIKMISTVETLKSYLLQMPEGAKKEYALYRIYKNIYSLLGQYFTCQAGERKMLKEWQAMNKDLIRKSARSSGKIHKISVALFGPFYGTILSYKLAELKGEFFIKLYK